MKKMFVLCCLAALSLGACCGGYDQLDYEGVRDEKVLKKLILKRFDFDNLEGFGRVELENKIDGEDSCKFLLLMDRKQKKNFSKNCS